MAEKVTLLHMLAFNVCGWKRAALRRAATPKAWLCNVKHTALSTVVPGVQISVGGYMRAHISR